MKSTVSIDKFKSRLDLLIGKPLWAAPAGGGTGSAVSMHIGDKIPRQVKCENPFLSEEAQNCEGELGLMIWCPWRIEIGGARIVCGSGEYERETMLSGLAKLIGQTVTEVSVDSFLDLLVSFSNGMRLRLFCEQGEEDVGGDVCYAFYVRNEEVWSVAKGEIACESGSE